MSHPKLSKASKTLISIGINLTIAAIGYVAIAHASSARPDTPAPAGTLEVSISHIARPGGTLMVGLYASRQDFEQGKLAQGRIVPVLGQSAKVAFKGLPKGQYALKVFEDMNGNRKIDFAPSGAPAEPFGFSNNAPALAGPASWNDAYFTVQAGKTAQQINLVQSAR